MIYVVTPSGELLEFPTANRMKYIPTIEGGGAQLYRLDSDKNEHYVAYVPNDWLIAYSRPQIPVRDSTLGALKRALRDFDARTGRWSR